MCVSTCNKDYRDRRLSCPRAPPHYHAHRKIVQRSVERTELQLRLEREAFLQRLVKLARARKDQSHVACAQRSGGLVLPARKRGRREANYRCQHCTLHARMTYARRVITASVRRFEPEQHARVIGLHVYCRSQLRISHCPAVHRMLHPNSAVALARPHTPSAHAESSTSHGRRFGESAGTHARRCDALTAGTRAIHERSSSRLKGLLHPLEISTE